mmetsp:Transcript_27455/g.89878  ORF Transcript_27455/g.89878 Transcript_27455/m.89878 type:complete len:115 (-) Transcript_27455:78-422(-)
MRRKWTSASHSCARSCSSRAPPRAGAGSRRRARRFRRSLSAANASSPSPARVYRALRRSLDAREQALCVADARLQSALATINLELLSSMSDGEFFAAPEAEAVEAGEDDEEEVD